jgi:hypothetical protein
MTLLLHSLNLPANRQPPKSLILNNAPHQPRPQPSRHRRSRNRSNHNNIDNNPNEMMKITISSNLSALPLELQDTRPRFPLWGESSPSLPAQKKTSPIRDPPHISTPETWVPWLLTAMSLGEGTPALLGLDTTTEVSHKTRISQFTKLTKKPQLRLLSSPPATARGTGALWVSSRTCTTIVELLQPQWARRMRMTTLLPLR